MDINEIADKLNNLSQHYKMKDFQAIRKKIHNLSRISSNKIFSPKTIFEKKNKYAFHYGGRKEIQYNIGYEVESGLFRYGLAFSLEKSHSLKDPVKLLTPKIKRFNEYIRTNSEKYSDMYMWHYKWDYPRGRRKIRSSNRKVAPIQEEFIKNGNFIFIGKYFNKTMAELELHDFREILKTFDKLLAIYEHVESSNVIEERVARICWNDYNWKKPSGRYGKSQNTDSYEHKTGFGHEEWLLDTDKIIQGYHYGYLQQIDRGWKKYKEKIFNISLYSINSYTGERWWIGRIKNVQVISRDEAKEIYIQYKKRGWLKEMVEQLRRAGAKTRYLISLEPYYLFNLKYKLDDLDLLDEPQRFSNVDPAVKSTYYSTLLNKERDPQLGTPEKDIFTFVPGHNKRKSSTKAKYGQRESSVDLFHNEMVHNSFKQLVKKHGKNNVASEGLIGLGSQVDLIVKEKDSFIFYEFKTLNSVKLCIREAFSQLLEYAYYPNKNRAKKLIIVSQNTTTKAAKEYLNKIRTDFTIPVYYSQYLVEQRCLDSAEY